MAKRELSSNLRSMKFMQRALRSDEKSEKEGEDTKPDGELFPSTTSSRKWCHGVLQGFAASQNFSLLSLNVHCSLVIMEGDPHPGAAGGRMSFQNFNPLIEKINETQSTGEAPTVSPNAQGAYVRENASSSEGSEYMDMEEETHVANGNLKRKQVEVVGDSQHPSKSPRNGQGIQTPSSSNSRSSRNQPKREKLDWSVLRPPKDQQRKG
ncbi:hypothetical protein SAY87_015885 [Trapa incisa]|uniref:Uncharacterized protein n=1 Tax=Trapa incisa TaxID=236973 RepID=A0AAN7QU05_9MYRT|nr:hypothetical protein SAY87_015885 [Trapa incisa]